MLPDCLKPYTQRLVIQPFLWRERQWRVPFYQVYARLSAPVAADFLTYRSKKVAILHLGKYHVPLFDPCRQGIDVLPAHAVVLSHCKGNRFGLYAFPADTVLAPLFLPLGTQYLRRQSQ
ncbi:hypothetical protein OCL06_03855 [Alteromonas sp. ASW11-19]|uniref:Uncharacterized protein n=1 Tax=Alteromonas salexigens TaxID=2982530 RepID=A0ABT2VKC5_9ALTE|nr:hypothetical protein [Alteromonas salexigens]MCU7553731.1 hypothetical protein [Alteromonas salexigens]